MNLSDSERIAGYLDGFGYTKVDDKYDADLVVITTCGVRQSAEDRVYGIIKRIKKNNSNVKIALTGCLSKRADVKKRLSRPFKNDSYTCKTSTCHLFLKNPSKYIDNFQNFLKNSNTNLCAECKNYFISGTKSLVDIWLPIEDLPSLGDSLLDIEKTEIDNISPKDYLKLSPEYSSKFSAFVPIGNGCDNFCTYCVVPFARGRVVYRPAEEIINEVKDLIEKGYTEITLIAQNVNSYKSDDINFPQLLKIVNDIPGEFWLRFSTSHPKDMSDELIQMIGECDKLCEYVHLPVQAGDDGILARMNRNYTAKHYLNLIDKIRKTGEAKKLENWSPPLSITTDIIVGFPGETKEQFNNTLDLCKKSKFNMAYIGQYSPRPNTPAYKLKDDISKEEKKQRENELMKVIRKTSLEDNKNYLEKIVEVLIDGKTRKGEWCGKTRTMKNVKLKINNSESKSNLLGKFIKVKINDVEDFGMSGELVM